MSDNLKTLGRDFDGARARWVNMPAGELRDDLCETLNDMAAVIRALPADDLAGLAIKAQAAAWAANIDLAHPDDVCAEAVAGLVGEIERLAGAA